MSALAWWPEITPRVIEYVEFGLSFPEGNLPPAARSESDRLLAEHEAAVNGWRAAPEGGYAE